MQRYTASLLILLRNLRILQLPTLHLGSTTIEIDIRDAQSLKALVEKIQPDFVFHLAAQALVRPAYTNPTDTWQINTMGTINLLESLRSLKNPCAAVLITSDKCYDNVEWAWGYRETDILGGPDPYSASKGAAELAIRSYVRSFSIGWFSANWGRESR